MAGTQTLKAGEERPMERKALVAYGSKNGSTAEIAERIGETLRQKGWQADVQDAGTVRDISPYSKII